ncbi:MAG: histidinol phosphatase [Candidatus Cloacimonetes bacterium]|nr:histidinol phosphatase [Candidatus Cloacimonadota bacterium]
MIIKSLKTIQRINLHLHSRVSDGALSPAQLIKRATTIGLDLISITDHDTCDAYRNLPEITLPLQILPGMEISSQHQGHDVHILAYGCDMENKALGELTEMYLQGRRQRAIKMIGLLGDMGMEISLDEVVAVAGSRELIVRPHIAQILVARGYVQSKNEAFEKYIGNFKPAFVPKPEVSVPEALSVIHNAGGLACLAHPGKLAKPEFLAELLPMGVDGLEVCHPDHKPEDIQRFIAIAIDNGLYMTGGSDFHGTHDQHNVFAAVEVPEIVLQSVNKLWQEYRQRRA